LSKGCHKLIKEGAKLVESVADLLHDLSRSPLTGLGSGSVFEYSGPGLPLLRAMGQGPVDTDTLASFSDLPAAFLAGQLLTLELAGQIERLPGGLFQRVNR
jgi:DNA processing protein